MATDPKKHELRLHSDEEIHPNELARVIKNEEPAESEKLKDIAPTPQNYKKFKGEYERHLPRGILLGVAGLVIFFITGSVVSFFVIKQKVKESISSQVGTLAAGVSDLQNLDPQSAARKFRELSGSSTPSVSGLLDTFGFLFRGGRDAAESFGDLTKQLATLSNEINSLETGMVDFIASGRGTSLISELARTRDTLHAIDADTNQLSGAVALFGGSSGLFGRSPKELGGNALGGTDWYLPVKAHIESTENFLTAFIPWLSSPTPRHVLVLFQNPSEMRPGGGFLGSYADVTIFAGNITDVSVHDVVDVDTGFSAKIIPPLPLQLEVKNWRPADANWFFDFPTSASKTIAFFEQSRLYAVSSTTFDGAIAVSPKIVSDLLSLMGPITISSTRATFTSDNFLVQIQKIVEQGRATSATYPKAVLRQLSQAIFQNIASSTSDEKQQLLLMALDWIEKKDAMVYFRNLDSANSPQVDSSATGAAFENFLKSHSVAGDVYQLPQNFNGDYLAIVDANIRGDKSDLYVEQSVVWNAEINADGTITDTVAIDRKHHGNQSPYWWYQTTNQDYLQIFVPDGSSLTNETGGIIKKIRPPINYARNGYSTDPALAAIESSTQSLFAYPAVATHEESGKEVFATWSRVAKGKSTKSEFDYTHRAFVPPSEGAQYQFVFEKQAGTNRNYDFTIDAPLGYVFVENSIASYEYQSDDPPGRLIINLTLKKI